MSAMHLTPADYVIKIFGGVRATARAIGRDPSAISKWRASRRKGGCGGHVPAKAGRTILRIAKRRKLHVSPHDLTYGVDVLKNGKK